MLDRHGFTIATAFWFLPEPLSREALFGQWGKFSASRGRVAATEPKMLTSNTSTFCRAGVEKNGKGLNHLSMNDPLMNDRSERKPRAKTVGVSCGLTLLVTAAVCAFFLGCSSADSKQQKAQAAAPRAVSVA